MRGTTGTLVPFEKCVIHFTSFGVYIFIVLSRSRAVTKWENGALHPQNSKKNMVICVKYLNFYNHTLKNKKKQKKKQVSVHRDHCSVSTVILYDLTKLWYDMLVGRFFYGRKNPLIVILVIPFFV